MATARTSFRRVARAAYAGGVAEPGFRDVAEEVPIAFSFLGSTYAVMMATPADLQDFATGFCLSEGIVSDVAQIEALEYVEADGGIDIQIRLAADAQSQLKVRQRMMAGPVGCGLCGVESIEAALERVRPVNSDAQFVASDIVEAVARLGDYQPLNRATRAAHAAGFYAPEHGMVAVCEDVGRHNALDKLVGCLARKGVDATRGIVVLSSRVSLEMVQKTARLGAPVLAAISAPTGLALDVAEKAGICVAAVARGNEFEIFTHGARIEMRGQDHVA